MAVSEGISPSASSPVSLQWDEVAEARRRTLETICREMREALPVKTRRWMGMKFKDCLDAQDIVAWLQTRGLCRTRQQAVEVGRSLQKQKYIVHVWGSHTKVLPFEDRTMYFRYTPLGLVAGLDPAQQEAAREAAAAGAEASQGPEEDASQADAALAEEQALEQARAEQRARITKRATQIQWVVLEAKLNQDADADAAALDAQSDAAVLDAQSLSGGSDSDGADGAAKRRPTVIDLTACRSDDAAEGEAAVIDLTACRSDEEDGERIEPEGGEKARPEGGEGAGPEDRERAKPVSTAYRDGGEKDP